MRPVVWMGTSRDDLRACPGDVQDTIGYALYFAQVGDTYRAVYTVKLKRAVYVLHVFQKKSTRGVATPRRELDLVRRRLNEAAILDSQGD